MGSDVTPVNPSSLLQYAKKVCLQCAGKSANNGIFWYLENQAALRLKRSAEAAGKGGGGNACDTCVARGRKGEGRSGGGGGRFRRGSARRDSLGALYFRALLLTSTTILCITKRRFD
ncbi:hypothetical protein R5R35_009798 [Gryllus longicercus]|uniref:Uncharacterized protein n=1 Tax=Gryllus longicercus TaxID=2509291 RepID=A0AAN9Z2I7_9ORTH